MHSNKGNKSVTHKFSNAPQATIQRSTFQRDSGYKTAFDSGYLIPIYLDEALPGDTFSVKLASVCRLATPLFPFMDNLHLDFHFFSVPNRLLWTNWQRFMGEQDNPGDSVDFTIPQFVSAGGTGHAVGTLPDYMGLPPGIDMTVNTLAFRAYNLIWNAWFRDENLQDSVQVDLDNGPDAVADYVLLRRGKRHDYFSSCLPWPQKGTAVDLPLGTTAPVYGTGKTMGLTEGVAFKGLVSIEGGHLAGATGYYDTNVGSTNATGTVMTIDKGIGLATSSGISGVYADLSTAVSATINSLREAFQLQKLFERDARGGSRYIEILKSHFQVTSPDERVQRPEYLGGGSTPVQVTPISQTSQTLAGTPQGHLTAIGYAQQSGIGFTKSFVEHSTIIGLASVRADLTYQQGVHRMFSRSTKYDFYWPALANLGETAVLNQEIFYQDDPADLLTFGYQEIWAEYRYKNSQITGILRSDAPSSLDAWHLAQDFAALPVLNSSFIQETPPVARVVAVPSEPEFIFDGYFSCRCTRPMPMYSVPGLIDHM